MRKICTLALSFLVWAPAWSITKEEALDFLYSSMSLPDKTDYTREFYTANVNASLLAREEMPWGSIVPDREFIHFVLPVRVNNENLDDSRMLFYEELKDRVKGLSMKDAILEVNHWCHEKVSYKPSDGRTSSPLSSVSQAIGRCGEESTFTVAALRSVGIPARQIYTPRWAHTDDNHAWVEAWADGKWHFLGACEPEPILDLAWFNEPASRGLLMSTNVTGDYQGPEEVLLKQPLTTRINVTANYAPVATLPVQVVTKEGVPVPGAKVKFCIYNYAEYYPAVTKTADADGRASLTAGLGDIVVWATDGVNYGITKGNPAEFADSHCEVVLDKDADFIGSFDFDLTPPPAGAKLPAVTTEQRAANTYRLQQEDSIRNAYIATFATPSLASVEATRLGVDANALETILVESRGNHTNIVKCLEALSPAQRQDAVDLLLNVTEKDRRDIPMAVIADAVRNSVANPGYDDDFYNKYILSPRIEIEYLRPWRGTLSEAFAQQAAEMTADPLKLAAWIKENITLADDENPMNLRMSPLAVLNTKKADATSRNIFFVAAARSIGIPARIDPVTASTQYSADGKGWIDVDFGTHGAADSAPTTSKGSLMLTYTPQGHIVDPKYYSQFSISRISSGEVQLLEFDENASLSSLFAEPYELEDGQYILTSGQRLANGGVLAHSEIFTVKAGKTTVKELTIRQDDSSLSVIGSLNAENIYHDIAADVDKSLLSTTGRGYYVLGLIAANNEPSAHTLNDMSAVAERLEDTGAKIMLLFENESQAARFNNNIYPDLPQNVVFGIDNDSVSRNEIVESLHLSQPVLPIFVVADTFNRIVWVSTGYTIGMGDTLLSILSRLQKNSD
ncbi:MAG: transglutaminase-like domain-containing protein [Muribaculaceae bacterium]|nr:transglutaminase-like domain-containing protein [Muribaculaceae bacterium]